ncbi:MAG: TonB-dependent receptor [Flavobacteriaceae bacterium]|nr:TonB-dependent receptor [Flavobacteriaceae bacterium]
MKPLYFIIFLFLISNFVSNAQTASVKGKVTDINGIAIEGVTVSYGKRGTTTDKTGFYNLKVPEYVTLTLVFSHVAYVSVEKRVRLLHNRTVVFSPKMALKTEQIDAITLKNNKKEARGVAKIKSKNVRIIPGANSGVENVLKTLPGVNSNNELSTQYNVRGGNFDENLVYVNGIEVYRPFLIRSGKQEGLSFVNPFLTKNINFSAGGFQAKYGDKMSSVLDITYKRPKKFALNTNASLLGANLTYENVLYQNRLSALIGLRYRNNSLLVNSGENSGNFKPNFTDFQSYFSFLASNKLVVDFLGNLSLNNYIDEPVTRISNFGTIANPVALIVNYEGKEKDQYLTVFGALKATYKYNDALTFNLITSAYNTQEEEHFDTFAFYSLGDVNADFGSDNFGNVQNSVAIGSQLNHARNDLDALISNIQIKASHLKDNTHIEVGLKYQHEDIKDRLIEWEVVDSAGFSIRPPHFIPKNDQPYLPYTGPIVPFISVRATNAIQINRFMGFAQYSKVDYINDSKIWYNFGLRAQHWQINGTGIESKGHTIISPRIQLAIKPDWDKDMLLRMATGVYQQPPFYRELRDSLGRVHPELEAQKSFHFVLGNDYSFKMWGRPFKLVTELYYKNISKVNPFTVENVRIRYSAKNNATAFASGLDIRLNGEFVPGTESWVSFGYLNTKENIDGRGFIARPTDQRLKFAILFQDYVPNYPNLKMYMNLVYNTGVPGGSPAFADPYLFQSRLPDYKRADIGILYELLEGRRPSRHFRQLRAKQMSVGFEIFNLFDVQNTISNTWVRDASSKLSFAVPNRLTGRVFNIKMAITF